jgi:hypothetical protein
MSRAGCTRLACIADKSLEICAPKAFGAGRGILGLRTIPLPLEEIYFEAAWVDSRCSPGSAALAGQYGLSGSAR